MLCRRQPRAAQRRTWQCAPCSEGMGSGNCKVLGRRLSSGDEADALDGVQGKLAIGERDGTVLDERFVKAGAFVVLRRLEESAGDVGRIALEADAVSIDVEGDVFDGLDGRLLVLVG